MTVTVSRRSTCRLCGSKDLECVVELEPIPLSEGYANDAEAARRAPRYPLDVFMCRACAHVQQIDVIDSQSLWSDYSYFSGEANGMPEHFRDFAAGVREQMKLTSDSLVIDIGSNDGSLLAPFQEYGIRVLGIDPAIEVAQVANDRGIRTLPEPISLDLARRIRHEYGPTDAICAFNVFAHADNLGEMADSIRHMLGDRGLFFFEAQYLLDIIDGVLIATIFHEHMSHHSVTPLMPFLRRHGLELIAVNRSPIQHGSLIGTVQVAGAARPIEASVDSLLLLEQARALDQIDTLRDFGARVKRLRSKITSLVRQWRAEGKTIAGFGAARSGPTLIAQLGLDGAMDYLVDDHPRKVGKYSFGDGLPIYPTAELLERKPDYTIILAWVHAESIINNNREYLEQGGHFVVLCPETRVVGPNGPIDV